MSRNISICKLFTRSRLLPAGYCFWARHVRLSVRLWSVHENSPNYFSSKNQNVRRRSLYRRAATGVTGYPALLQVQTNHSVPIPRAGVLAVSRTTNFLVKICKTEEY